ncbi:hypothetical protein ACWD4V_02245 [Streptomyces tsukubensis]
MTAPGVTTHVTDPRGATHTGSGNQYNYVTWMISNERLLRTGVPRLRIMREHRLRLAGCFVRPRFYSLAADRVHEPGGVVLLSGPVGAGRRAAATMLLEEASAAESLIEELPPNPEEDGLEVAPDGLYLLDLSLVTDSDYPSAQHVLARYRSLVEECGARMVVVLPAGLDWMLAPDLSPAVVRIERPRGRAVFSRHLQVHGLDFQPEYLAIGALEQMFTDSPMRELARLAELVAQARASGRYGTSFTDWRDAALEAVTNRSEQVSQQLRERRDGMQRALLITAAMISGARADAVLSGARTLLDLLGHQPEETPVLSQADLGERLEQLSIARDDDGRVSFSELAYDSAVREHFWRNFPGLQADFRNWVGQFMELPELRGEDRMRLVARFTEQALDAGRPDDLCVLVERWTRPSAAGRLRAEAAAVLELGLSHDQYGSRLRARVYTWVTGGSLAPDLVRVLTDVCRQVMAATHPDQALVRLRHLALRQGGTPGATARQALVDLARSRRRLLVRLIDRLLRSVPLPDSSAELLLGLLEPGDTGFAPPWTHYTLAWRAVMVSAPVSAWTPAVERWLSQSLSQPESDQGLHVLILAAMDDPARLTRLYVTARNWADRNPVDDRPEPPDLRQARLDTAERFCQKLDLLQGVEATDLGSDTYRTWEAS